jgi:VWFA-related protein
MNVRSAIRCEPVEEPERRGEAGPRHGGRGAAIGLVFWLLDPVAFAQQRPTFPATAELVRIDAVVVDEAGRPVTGLTAADFAVEENGKPREIASFEPIVVRSVVAALDEPVPATVSAPRALEPQEGRALLIYFDDIHVSPPSAEWVRHNLGPFLQREVRPGDAVTIVTPHGGLWWTARTPWEHAQLPAVVERLKGQYARPFKDEPSDWRVMQDVEYGQKIREDRHTETDTFSLAREGQYGMALLRIRRSLNGLERAIDSLDGFRGRKSVIIYSEGFILSPQLPDYERIIDRCRRANVALFVADPRGLRTGLPTAESPSMERTSGAELEAESAGSTHIAVATGGRGFSANDATEAVGRVLAESTAYYLIGFRPAEGRPGERMLRVRVRREGLRVRARNRYYWGDPVPRGNDDSPDVLALRAMSDRTGDAASDPARPGRRSPGAAAEAADRGKASREG